MRERQTSYGDLCSGSVFPFRTRLSEAFEGASDAALNDAGLCFADILQQNDAYPALAKIGGLIMTGPTGTNVNDLAVLLLAR